MTADSLLSLRRNNLQSGTKTLVLKITHDLSLSLFLGNKFHWLKIVVGGYWPGRSRPHGSNNQGYTSTGITRHVSVYTHTYIYGIFILKIISKYLPVG